MARQRRLAFLATNPNTFRLLVLLVFFCLVTALVRRVSLSFFKDPRPGEPVSFESPRITAVIHGRWSSVRTALDLAPPLSHEVVLTLPPEPDAASPGWPRPPANPRASRFDLASKRRRLPQLRFATPNARPEKPPQSPPSNSQAVTQDTNSPASRAPKRMTLVATSPTDVQNGYTGGNAIDHG